MKKLIAEIATLTPDAQGWRICLASGAVSHSETLSEAVAAIPADQLIDLALPGNLVLLERLTLPALDREELAGMVALQLEKTLPYPVEEACNDFEVVRQSETDSVVLSVAANVAQLNGLCEPLRAQQRLPQRITLFAMHLAASCPVDEVVLWIWPELDHLEVAICEHGKLGFAQSLLGADAETLQSDLPQILLSAEMEGVPTRFSRVRLAQSCESLQTPVSQLLDCPVEICGFDFPLPALAINLAPPSWQAEARRLQGAILLRQRLQTAAVVYLILVAGAFVYLAWTKSRVRRLERELAQVQPEVDFVQAQALRSEILAPAIDRSRYAIEILYQINKNRPSEQVKITKFHFDKAGFSVEGELPDPGQAVGFVTKLKAEPLLRAYRIDYTEPTLLENGTAQYSITGKL